MANDASMHGGRGYDSGGRRHHFLIVSGAAQGQITPARRLSHLLARSGSAWATLAVPLSALRRMFPGKALRGADAGLVISDGRVDYAAFTDGFDEGFQPAACDGAAFIGRLRLVGPASLATLAAALHARGRPVTCVIYTLLLPFAATVARDLSVPAFFFWTMPATVLSVYYHYFHHHAELVDAVAAAGKNCPDCPAEVPGLPFLRVRDLPSLLTGPSPFLPAFREMFDVVEAAAAGGSGKGKTRARVLVNTFDALEPEALKSVPGIDLIPVGPMVTDTVAHGGAVRSGDLFEEDHAPYMKWLDEQRDGSIVYVSFGSLAVLCVQQLEEIRQFLEASHRPFLWVVRRDNCDAAARRPPGKPGRGLVVEWCSQARVLAHSAVGCFVTHCGWNSMLESVSCGVPVIMAPQWSDQATNARMAEAQWGVGVRAQAGADGIVRAAELARCVEVVMGDTKQGCMIRARAKLWKARAAAALCCTDSAASSLRRFLDGVDEWQ